MGLTKYFKVLILVVLTGMTFSGGKATGQGFYFYNNGFYESQTVIEFGLTAGAMNCLSDLGGSKKGKANAGFLKDFTFNETNFTAGLYVAATYKDFIAGRIDFNFGKVQATDQSLQGTTDEYAKGRLVRNLDFRSNIFEIAAAVELHPLFITDYVDREPPRFSPYAFAGFGWTKFNPQGSLNGKWYNLDELHLEGEGFKEYPDRKPWKKNALAFPLGIGVRYEASQLFTLRLEISRHFLATDYLDGVSQGDWVDIVSPGTEDLFYKNLPTVQLATAAYGFMNKTDPKYRTTNGTRPRGNPDDNDAFWNIVFKVGINLNRQRM